MGIPELRKIKWLRKMFLNCIVVRTAQLVNLLQRHYIVQLDPVKGVPAGEIEETRWSLVIKKPS